MPRRTPEQWWERIERTESCWIWRGYVRPDGYGATSLTTDATRGEQMAHRVAYILAKGPIPTGLEIDHLCRNRACCNPAHLEAVTPLENTRRTPGVHKLVCDRGHAMAGDNVVHWHDGERPRRSCRICKLEYARRWKRAHRRRPPIGVEHPHAKLNDEAVREIRASVGVSKGELARRFGVARPQITAVLERRTWRHVTDAPTGSSSGSP